MYNDDNLYIAVDVADDVVRADDVPNPFWEWEAWEDDDVEIYIDGDRVNGCPPAGHPLESLWALADCSPAMGTNDFWDWTLPLLYPVVTGEEGYQLSTSVTGKKVSWPTPGFPSLVWDSAAGLRPRGYMVEFEIALTSIDTEDGDGIVPPQPGDEIGFNVAVNDDDGADRETQGFWDGQPLVSVYFLEHLWGTLYFKPLPPGRAKKPAATPSTWGAVKELIK